MTNREKDILNIIESNPFISQNEIADLLKISRSSVSVHLNTMYKKGIIRGRGYIIGEETYPVLIGPSHIDIRSICAQPPNNQGVYDNAKTQILHGGPIKNTAEHLIGLGIAPRAIFAVAADSFGASFLDSCERSGINIDGSLTVDNASSPVYTEMVDESLRLIAASFASDNLSSHLTPNHLSDQYAILKNASSIVVHDSVPADSVEYLHRFKSKADMVLVSSDILYTAPVAKTFPIFTTAVFPYYIAQELVGISAGAPIYGTTTSRVACGVAKQLSGLGIPNFYMLIDSTCLLYCDGSQVTLHNSANPVGNLESATAVYMKCRDIFAAVVTYGLENNLEHRKTLDLMAAARNLSFNSDSYFNRGFTISLLEEGGRGLNATVETHSF